MNIFIINGLPNSGKHTFIKEIQETIPNVMLEYYIRPVERIAERMGWSGYIDEQSTKLLKDLEYLWSNYNNKLQDILLNTIFEIERERYTNPTMFIIITNPKIIDIFKQLKKCKTILIKRDGIKADNYKYDIVIDNKGTLDELKDKARKFIGKHLKTNLILIRR